MMTIIGKGAYHVDSHIRWDEGRGFVCLWKKVPNNWGHGEQISKSLLEPRGRWDGQVPPHCGACGLCSVGADTISPNHGMHVTHQEWEAGQGGRRPWYPPVLLPICSPGCDTGSGKGRIANQRATCPHLKVWTLKSNLSSSKSDTQFATLFFFLI